MSSRRTYSSSAISLSGRHRSAHLSSSVMVVKRASVSVDFLKMSVTDLRVYIFDMHTKTAAIIEEVKKENEEVRRRRATVADLRARYDSLSKRLEVVKRQELAEAQTLPTVKRVRPPTNPFAPGEESFRTMSGSIRTRRGTVVGQHVPHPTFETRDLPKAQRNWTHRMLGLGKRMPVDGERPAKRLRPTSEHDDASEEIEYSGNPWEEEDPESDSARFRHAGSGTW